MDFRSLAFNAIIIGAFMIGLFYFAINFSIENDTNVSLADNVYMGNYINDISSKINETQNTTNSMRIALNKESSNPIISALGFVFKSILSTGEQFGNFIIPLLQSSFILIQEGLGIPSIFLGIITSLILITIVLSLWRVYRAGE